jgi:hypothetical protein
MDSITVIPKELPFLKNTKMGEVDAVTYLP